MNTKLTLNVDDSVIFRAKEYAQKGKTSLSKLVENYLKSLSAGKSSDLALPPIVESLRGAVVGDKKNREYKKIISDAIFEKHK